jgi:hypothetical protein
MLTPSEFEARQEGNFDEHRSIRPVLGPTERRALRSLHNTRGVQSPLDQSDSPMRRAEDIWLEAPLLAVGAGELGLVVHHLHGRWFGPATTSLRSFIARLDR